MQEGTIYYAIDDKPEYTFAALQSIKSLRLYNKKIRVYLYHSGTLNRALSGKIRSLDVKISSCSGFDQFSSPCLKWFALLKHPKEHPALFLDADTLFFAAPRMLFGTAATADFCARQELNTAGRSKVMVDLKAYKQLAIRLGAEPKPIFNTGVMLMSPRFMRGFTQRMQSFKSLISLFHTKKETYPSTNWHLIDEIAASIIFGHMNGLSHKFLDAKLSPWFFEWERKVVPSPGVVMHTGFTELRKCYRAFLSNDVEHQFLRLVEATWQRKLEE